MQARQGDFPSDGRKKHGKTIQKMGPVTGSKWGLQYFTPVDPVDFRLFIRVILASVCMIVETPIEGIYKPPRMHSSPSELVHF